MHGSRAYSHALSSRCYGLAADRSVEQLAELRNILVLPARQFKSACPILATRRAAAAMASERVLSCAPYMCIHDVRVFELSIILSDWLEKLPSHSSVEGSGIED